MHKEGLIQLQTQRGRSPEVRIIDWENQVDLPDEETSLYTSDVAHVGK